MGEGKTFKDYEGLTFADLKPDPKPFDHELIRSVCPGCGKLIEGTLKEIEKHMEGCDGSG